MRGGRGGFVRVSPSDPTRLELPDGSPFFFAGANCYYLLMRGADPALRHECTTVLDDAAAAGLTVLRAWAFADGPSQWNALQPSPGVFDERVFRSLDWLLAEAAARGLRLLLVLTNFWENYGGMRQYVAWAREQRGEQAPPGEEGQQGANLESVEAEPFYTDPDCQRMFRAFLRAMALRVSSLTGVAYCDDPTILAWGLANEPRCAGDEGCAILPRWADSMAGFLKSLDPNHMVTLDIEGFLGPSTPDACRRNPYNCAGSGCDFAADCSSPHIDFACCHLYPDHWRPAADKQDHLSWSLAWLDCHVAIARQQLRKPLVLSEFGKRRRGSAADDEHRAEWYSQVLGRVLRHMRSGSGLAGFAFWLLAAPSYPDHDGFTVYLSGPQAAEPSAVRAAIRSTSLRSTSDGSSGSRALVQVQPVEQEEEEAQGDEAGKQGGVLTVHTGRTAAIIRRHAARVAALNRGAAAEPTSPQVGWEGNPLLQVQGTSSGLTVESTGAVATAGSTVGGSVGAGGGSSATREGAGGCRCCSVM